MAKRGTSLNKRFDNLDSKIVNWMKKEGHLFLRYSLAVIFIWFGILKPLGFSPALDLVTKTVYWFPPETFVPILGWWEVIIGICLLYKPLIRLGIFLMAIQMAGTFLPLILLPEIVYTNGNPFYLTLEGQYIIKNLVIIGAAMVIGSHARD
ncbi:MAG: hypothetical protein Q8R00_01835 [Candidatus Nanoarchaeia archaeon]|nr:hypothetical protein [Candidatus Nanoarchaeia archaeon]